MSKMDGLRAMREARYEAATRGTRPAATARPAVRPAPAPSPAEARSVAADPEVSGLCGHRNMSGRSCTREHGHAAKSHRYS